MPVPNPCPVRAEGEWLSWFDSRSLRQILHLPRPVAGPKGESTMKYNKLFSTRQTPQSQPIPGSGQVPNSAGGYAWAVDDWKRLSRFLILGSEGGSYYATERKLTVENAEAVRRCIQA